MIFDAEHPQGSSGGSPRLPRSPSKVEPYQMPAEVAAKLKSVDELQNRIQRLENDLRQARGLSEAVVVLLSSLAAPSHVRLPRPDGRRGSRRIPRQAPLALAFR